MDFLNPVFEAIGWLLALFYGVIPNLGVAIILLTFTIMLLLYPLTAKQAKSMIAMQRAQPEIKKLQAKYKGDKQKLNEETMKFYQENKINPLAGCLPLLVQMPIFFALFRVLQDPEKYVPSDSSLYADLCRAGDGVLKGVDACAKSINHLFLIGGPKTGVLDLQLSATDAHNGVLNAAPYFLLVGAVMLTGFLQTRQAQKRTPVANKQMGMVMKVLPVFFGLISLQFPAGLVLYFFVSNLWRLGQQEVIFRRFGSALHPTPGGKALPGAGTKKAAVIDVESRDAVEEDRNGDGATPAPRKAAAAKPKPKATSTGQQGGGAPAPAPRRGLRGLFELPPPPDGGSGGTPGKPGGTRGGSSSSKATPKPPPTRSRSNKKKRKR